MSSKKHTLLKKIPSKKTESNILDADGNKVFQMMQVLAPVAWSQLAIDIAASKYFFQNKETSIYDLVDRMASGFSSALSFSRYSVKDRDAILEKIVFGLLTQKYAFNSPVWFNCGLHEKYKLNSSDGESYAFNFKNKKIENIKNSYQRPQNSACFIQSVDDSLSSIYDLLKKEALLFKFGSGSGTNFSKLRSRYENLKSGGKSSGLISFLEVFDKSAGSIKSGGVTRRAAKMVCLDIDHPEIFEFIQWKKNEELKAQALIQSGYSGSIDGEVYKTISGQNSNNSVRVTDLFMKKMLKDQFFNLKYGNSKKIFKKVKAQDLWNQLCESAWHCADPGVQFHDVINRMNPCRASGTIRASNPCSEFMFLDNTACNLASLNLVKYANSDEGVYNFNFKEFINDVTDLIRVQDALVDYSSYPSYDIALNSHQFRPLGLGFANLGSLFIESGISYDSDLARALASAITAAMTGQSYLTSATLAEEQGSFGQYRKNKKYVKQVFKKQLGSLKKINWLLLPVGFEKTIRSIWSQAELYINKYGLRNAQLTLIAPTGTIGLVMDCGTTGIEPEFSIFKTKKMAGGGVISILNPSIEKCLTRLGYSEENRKEIIKKLSSNKNIFEIVILNPQHREIFKTSHGAHDLSAEAHLLMMAAVQPFISGAISKTVNMPFSSTVQDISKIYQLAWKLKLKSVAIYRDRSKFVQPLSSDFEAKARKVEKITFDPFKFENPKCVICGVMTVREGPCFKCANCGYTSSCVG